MRSPVIVTKETEGGPPAETPPEAAPPSTIPVPDLEPPRWFARFDIVLLLMLIVLVFCLGSFVAANSDVHMSLATGKLLAGFDYSFGTDPFACTTQGVYWANHSWLYSWLIYLVQGWFGDTGLVAFKAALLVVLALVLVRIRQRSTTMVLSIFFVGLALLVVSPRFLLQPVVMSYLLLGVTVWLMWRGGMLDRWGADAVGQERARYLWYIPLVCILWVNLDAWFWLGPWSVGLVWGGNGLAQWLGKKGPLPGALQGKIFGLSVLALVVNPHHIWALALPPELAYLLLQITGSLGDALPDWLVGGGRALQGMMVHEAELLLGRDAALILVNEPTHGLLSPFSINYMKETAAGWGGNVAGVAFYVLLLLSMGSFVAMAVLGHRDKAPQPSLGRLFLWLFLGLLASAQARLIPWFAIVAGPITVLNLGEVLAWQHARARDIDWRYGRLARMLTFIGLAAALFLAWPGWLNATMGDPDSPRRVDWAIELDPSLAPTAHRLAELKQGNNIGNVFNTSLDLAHYCARFAPGVRCFLDSRTPLFAQSAEIHGRTRRLLVREADVFAKGGTFTAKPAWPGLFRRHGIDHVTVTNYDHDQYQVQVAQFLGSQARDFTLRYADGRMLVFAWRADKPNPPGENLEQTWGPLAFGSRAKLVPARSYEPVEPRGELEDYVRGFGKRPLGVSKAYFYLNHHEGKDGGWRPFCVYTWYSSLWLGLGQATPATPGGFWSANVFTQLRAPRLVMSSQTPSGRPALRARDFGPPELPILAMRSVQEALADNPRHPDCYLMLANASKALLNQQEDFWANHLGFEDPSFRTSLRQAQILYGLRSTLELVPDNAVVHRELARLLESMYYLDAAHEHWVKSATHMKLPPIKDPGKDPAKEKALRKAFEEAKKNLVARNKGLEAELIRRQRDYSERSRREKGLTRALVAFRFPYHSVDAENKNRTDRRGMGLALEGLKQLELFQQQARTKGDEAERSEALFVQTQLLINLGRVNEVHEALPTLQAPLGRHYSQIQALCAAALGDYTTADKALAAMDKDLDPQAAQQQAQLPFVRSAALFFADLEPGWHRVLHQMPAVPHYMAVQQMAEGLESMIRRRAEARVVRGMLALEQGDTTKARQHFQDALAVPSPRTHFPDAAIAQRYLELLE